MHKCGCRGSEVLLIMMLSAYGGKAEYGRFCATRCENETLIYRLRFLRPNGRAFAPAL